MRNWEKKKKERKKNSSKENIQFIFTVCPHFSLTGPIAHPSPGLQLVWNQFSFFSTSFHTTVKESSGGVHGVMVIVVENGHGDSSSNPAPGLLHFT